MSVLKLPAALVLLLAAAFVAPASAADTSPSDALRHAREKLDGLTSYHLQLDDETGPVEIDYTVPQRVRITQPASVAIIVGGGVYLNPGKSGWTPAGVNPTLGVLMATLQEDRLLTFTEADELADRGVSLLDGASMHVYEIRTPVNGSSLRRLVWVGEKDGLPHHVERTGGIGKLTATYSGYNENFAIEVPPGMQPATQH
jgi:outer membrane lipoprotein-sorting protein